jgi:NTE family protein
MKITHISFSGAGMSGLAYLGVIRYLQMEGLDRSIYSIAGTSMGAFFACVLALGIPAGTMESDLKAFAGSSNPALFFEANALMNVFHDLGMDVADKITTPLHKYFEELWGTRQVTFLDFVKKTGKDLIICASCIEKGEAEYFSVDKTPNVDVLTAIQASMAVPMVFKPVQIGDYHYVDGGITDNHPVDCFGTKALESMLAVKVVVTNMTIENPFENVISYLIHIIQMSFRYWDRQFEKAKYCMILNKPPVPFMPCEYSKEGVRIKITDRDVDSSIEYGFIKAHELFKASLEQLPSEQ